MHETAEKLEKAIYDKLVKKGELTLNEVLDIFDSVPEYGLRKVIGLTNQRLRGRTDVEFISNAYTLNSIILRLRS